MIDHLSASQLSRFTRCAEMWRRQYIEGDIVPVGAAAHIGQAVHKAAEINFRQKIQSRTDLPADVLQDAAVQEFIRSVRDEGIYFTPKQRQNVQQFLAQSLAGGPLPQGNRRAHTAGSCGIQKEPAPSKTGHPSADYPGRIHRQRRTARPQNVFPQVDT